MDQRYVIIRGQVFRWEEKAPFVKSGKSVQGAIEYRKEQGVIRCHVCGEWKKSLSGHLKRTHPNVSQRDYRREHCLRQSTALSSPESRSRRRLATAKRGFVGFPLALRKPQTIEAIRKASHAPRVSKETANLNGTCAAQTIFGIQQLAIELGRTPTEAEGSNKLKTGARNQFGSWTKACSAAGLEPCGSGRPGEAYSKTILLDSIRDFYVLNKRIPGRSDFGFGRLPSLSTFNRYFGSLRNSLVEAGFGLIVNGVAA